MTLLQATANASGAGLRSSSSGLTGVWPMLFVILWVAVIGALVLAARNSEYFGHLVSVGNALAVSAYYAIHGVAAVTATVIVLAPAYLVATADPSTQSQYGRYALYAVGAYIALAVVGYLFKHYVVTPVVENADEAGLLPDPDDSEEASA